MKEQLISRVQLLGKRQFASLLAQVESLWRMISEAGQWVVFGIRLRGFDYRSVA